MNTDKHPAPGSAIKKDDGSGPSTFSLAIENEKQANTKPKQQPRMTVSRRYCAGAQAVRDTNLCVHNSVEPLVQ